MKANENEILTIAGKRVEVRHCKQDYCDKCCLDDVVRCYPKGPCVEYNKDGLHAYFVPAKEIEGISQKVTLIPSNEDADKAAEMAARRAYPYEGGTKGDICEASIPIFCKGFKAGIAYERERATKETFDTFLHTRAKRSGVEVADCRIVRVGDHNAVEVETDEYYSGLERFSDGDKVNLIIVKKEVQL